MRKVKLVLLSIVLFVILIAGIYFGLRFSANQKQETAVIQQIRTLNRWETSSYTVEQIIDNGGSGNLFQRMLFGDRILLIAHGTVVAGFDLTNLSEKNIHTDGKSITITLPAPEIFSTALDESQTRVYDRQKGLLAPSNDNLESDARLSAVNKIRQAACSGGVLTNATENGKKQLTTMLQSLGFTTITITIPEGHC